MTKIHCRCVGCKAVRVYTDYDLIDEAGPHCEKCLMPMVPFKIEQSTAKQVLA
jgi:hypothetical protein